MIRGKHLLKTCAKKAVGSFGLKQHQQHPSPKLFRHVSGGNGTTLLNHYHHHSSTSLGAPSTLSGDEGKADGVSPASTIEWTSQQVCQRLASPIKQGGANLSDEMVKPLLDAQFDGTSLADIARNITELGRVGAIDYTCKIFTKIPPDTIQTVVNWVNDRIIQPTNKSKHLLEAIQQAREKKGKKKQVNFNHFYSEPREELALKHSDMVLKWADLDDFEQKLLAKTDSFSPSAALGHPSIDERYQSTELPVVLDSIVKQRLPYFSQFQYPTKLDETLLKRLDPNMKRSAFMFMAPSGSGKTAACVRLLCNNPGMFFTCSSSAETPSGWTNDALMSRAFRYLNGLGSLYELFGSVEQVVLMVYICRLIYILKLINQAKQNPNIFEEFVKRDENGNINDGGILPYLAYMQSNGYTKYSNKALDHALSFVYSSPDTLRMLISNLVSKIINSLNEHSVIFGISKPIETFVVVIDEANVYESNDNDKLSQLINSWSGEKRGLITKFAHLIGTLNIFHVSIFCGTNFSVDVGSILQSNLGKTEAKIDLFKEFDFGLIKVDELIPFLKLHINLPDEDEKEVLQYCYEHNYKYFRRRLVTLALGKLDKNNTLLEALKLSVQVFVDGPKQELEVDLAPLEESESIEQRASQQGIRNAIVNYVSHYHFQFLGSKFEVSSNDVGNTLLCSGFSGPESWSNKLIFSAMDFIGYETGLELLKKIFGIEDRTELMRRIIQEKVKLFLDNSDHNIDLKSIVMLRLAELDGKSLSETGCFSPLFEKNPNFKDQIFKCKQCLDGNGYVEYCISKGVIDPEKKNGFNGEELFWKHFADSKWDLLDGIFITPSNSHHNDIFGINRVEGSNMIIPFGFQVMVQTGGSFDIHSYFRSSAGWLKDIRNDVLATFQSSQMMHVCVGLHTTETFSKSIVKKYENNYLCSFVDMSNIGETLFDKEWKSYLKKFVNVPVERQTINDIKKIQ